MLSIIVEWIQVCSTPEVFTTYNNKQVVDRKQHPDEGAEPEEQHLFIRRRPVWQSLTLW